MAGHEASRHAFPSDLRKEVDAAWHTAIGGEYTPPAKPAGEQLQAILEAAYLATLETDESRQLRFTLCVTPAGQRPNRRGADATPVETWAFYELRRCDVQELRRLAAATDVNSSAIWITAPADAMEPPQIGGLLNLGSSWFKARSALSYLYEPLPHALLIRCDAPGRLTVYQGEYVIACLKGGEIVRRGGPTSLQLLGVGRLVSDGLTRLGARVERPHREDARHWAEFEFLAHTNTLLAIVNAIQKAGHGGTLILAGSNSTVESSGCLRAKYPVARPSPGLAARFISFMNARHEFGDLLAREEAGQKVVDHRMQLAHETLIDRQTDLAETCAFLGRLAGVDGALALTTDLELLGFGIEIVLDQLAATTVWEVLDDTGSDCRELNTEQFGTRHRSAMRLCSAVEDAAAFVVSQDGAVTLVWKEKGQVRCRRDVRTANANMVLA